MNDIKYNISEKEIIRELALMLIANSGKIKYDLNFPFKCQFIISQKVAKLAYKLSYTSLYNCGKKYNKALRRLIHQVNLQIPGAYHLVNNQAKQLFEQGKTKCSRLFEFGRYSVIFL